LPNDAYEIVPYAAEEFPEVFETVGARVQAVKADRTFWEKATILHQEAHRLPEKPSPARYSRHYYDLDRMAHSSVRHQALKDLDLLNDVVLFKQKFYPCAWARYDLATPGTMKLVPAEGQLDSLAGDYKRMQVMIFGEAPSFEEIIKTLSELEDEGGRFRVCQYQ